jgi:putative sigma-54 modulation protein
MHIEYVGRSVELTDEIRDFVAERIPRVLKFLEEPVDVRLTLVEEKHRQIAELHVAHRFGLVQATGETADLHESIVAAINKGEKQARRNRKKFFDRRRRVRADEGQHHWPVEVLDRATFGEGTAPRVIKSSNLIIESMQLDEAAAKLDASEHDFVVFRESDTDRVSVLYRRRDDHYGLITTEA